MKQKIKNEKGITLIALVITIIVLLILAGIAISMLTGDNSILKKAGEARTLTEDSDIQERINISYVAALADGVGDITKEAFKEELIKQFGADKITDDTIKTSEDKKTWTVTIDGTSVELKAGTTTEDGTGVKDKNGTKLATGTGTTPYLPNPSKNEITEPDLNKGLTIKDENDNEWVWIEVPNAGDEDKKGKTWVNYAEVGNLQKNSPSDITGKTDAYYTAIANDLRNYCTVAKDGTTTLIAKTGTKYKTTTMGWKDEWYDGCGVVDKDEKTGAQRYKDFYYAMLDSIYTNGGFYIGKYETGYKTTGNKRAAKNENQSVSDLKNAYKPLIQVDAYPYNYVTCSQAEGLSETLATGGKNCTLMFGIQWDLVLKYLNVKGGKGVADLTSDSKNWGNYSDDTITITNSNAQSATSKPYSSFNKATTASGLLTTGASSDAGPLNVFDFAGNVSEWTLEHATTNTSYPCAVRGGYFDGGGSGVPASSRDSSGTADGYLSYGGFRCTLY